ncbi:MAG: peptide ABC transporter substrate-binding protein [Anaerolineae bacterium]
MFRGFRWQLLALLAALVVFGFSLTSRNTADMPSGVVPTSTATEAAGDTTPEPTVESLPTAMPQVITAESPTNIPTYREGLIGGVSRLNPLFADLNPVDRDISSLIFEGLTRINQYGEPVPNLAKSWVTSTDGLDYIFQLRDDILWQDGIAFGPADVTYTIGLLQSPDFPGDPALGKFWQTVEVQQLDDHHIRFRLTQPLGRFLDAVSVGILPEHALRGTTASTIASHPINLSPIGTGPYQLEAVRTDDSGQVRVVDLRAAPVFRQRVEGGTGYEVERISFHLYDVFDEALDGLKSGEIDGLAGRDRTENNTLLSLSGVNVHTAFQPTLGALIFNWASDQTAFFREQRVRQALQIGLDRAPIIQRVLGSEAVQADSPLFPGSWAYDGDVVWPRVDVAAAIQLLDTARWNKSSDTTSESAVGTRFSFKILTPDDPKLVALAQEIAGQWSQLNIGVSVETVDRNSYEERLNSSAFDASLVELAMGNSADPDVYQFWDADQYPDGKNYGGVDDRRIAEELERARSDYNGLNRAIRYRQFQQDFVGRAIAIPLYYPLFVYATKPRLEGVQIGYLNSPSSRFITIEDWKVNFQ